MVDIFQYNLARSFIQQWTIKHELTAQIFVDLALQRDERVIDGGNDHVYTSGHRKANEGRHKGRVFQTRQMKDDRITACGLETCFCNATGNISIDVETIHREHVRITADTLGDVPL